MKEFLNILLTIIILIATVILGGFAVIILTDLFDIEELTASVLYLTGVLGAGLLFIGISKK